MTESSSKPTINNLETENLSQLAAQDSKPKDSYVKLAMRNMVRKGGQSLWHFFLTTVALLGLLVGLAYLTKP